MDSLYEFADGWDCIRPEEPADARDGGLRRNLTTNVMRRPIYGIRPVIPYEGRKRLGVGQVGAVLWGWKRRTWEAHGDEGEGDGEDRGGPEVRVGIPYVNERAPEQ